MENNQANEVKTKKKSKKKWIIFAIIALILIIFISAPTSSEPSVEPIVGNSTSANQSATQEIKVGSAISDDYLKISYKSCNADFKNYSNYLGPKSGYKVVEAVFDFENISQTDQILNGFECYADGDKCEEFYFAEDYSSPILETISAGRKLTNAKIYYEVPKDAKVIELEYEADSWSEEKYIFIVE